ncbi:SDR family NAD(P)-dependent oxidoreductase [Rheinheimera riviphila]|uniref:SDR family NAD(P)-dependent oxidoreductase n=1 Tax=Rheinheimera riviphila TaxID=1834037 RepID=A0A437R226_9GAMM|nr:type I polyketide synthase [Rheinheimera riviphila]RVU40808.1 SDR family NAD(P)-dependent oxidoreductase [Rheinheimera riviphila]
MSEHIQTQPEATQSAEAMKKLFVEYKKAQDKLQQLQQQRTEPLAIIGASCRFPGGANDLQQFWQVLSDGINAITPVDPKRWDAAHYYADEQKAAGKMYTTHGGYLQLALDQFDHQFFAVSPKEAKALDPQQRLLLEVSWEAMEVAALDPQQLKGSATSVFIGMSSDDYAHAHLKSGDPTTIDAYSMTGATHSTAAGRLSYTFGFEGPAVTVDTACSSSNVALHLACQSLRSGESDLALVGGVNLILTPIAHIAFTKLQAISPHGIVRTFDADASGYVRAEGCGMVVVKRLSDALRDGDPIMALVRGTAVNQDGRSNGFTAPSGLAQQKVIRQALQNAGLNALDVDYVEAHGTGTPLGDPIEVEALQTVYGEGRPATHPLKLGSVKTNLGHLEPAAAISGLIKLLLAFSHRQLPASLNFATPNPHIQWQGAPVQVISELQDWQAPVAADDSHGVRRAGLSSFGFSGTNSHVIVEQAPQISRQLQSASAQLLILSGRQLSALQQQAERFADFLQLQNVEMADLAYTSTCGRSLFQERLALVVSDKASAINALRQIADGQLQGADRVRISSHEHKSQSLALLFTGQGSQYVGMARELYQQQPVFRQALDEVTALFSPELELPLLDVLWHNTNTDIADDLINQTAYAQPAIFAVQYALAQQWLADGVTPHYVAGHSIGEYAAAVVAGVFSLADAVRLVAARGRLMQQAPGHGGMTAVFAPRPAVDSLLLGYRGQLSVAAVNATDVTVVSGALDAMAQFIADCQAQDLETRPLVVSHGFHSPLMEPVLQAFAEVAATVQYHEPAITFVSALTGQPERKALTRPDYWVAHVREAVLFLPVLQYLQQQQVQLWLEVGGTDTLLGLARRLLQQSSKTAMPQLIASQKRDQPGLNTYLLALGQLQLVQPMPGVAAFYRAQQARRVAIPTYPFQRESHWMPLRYDFTSPQPTSSERTQQSQLGARLQHSLLGERFDTPALGEQIVFAREYSATTPYFMAEHIVYDTPISPAAAHVSMLLSAARDVLQQPVAVLENIDFLAPLIARDGERRAGQVILTPDLQQQPQQQQHQFVLVSRDALLAGSDFTRHCSGRVLSGINQTPAALDLAALRQKFTTEVDVSAFNQFFSGLGFKLGDGFRRIQQVFKGHNEGLSRLTLKADVPDQDIYLVYPGLIDSLFHTSLPVSALDFVQLQQDRRAFIPISIGRVCLYAKTIPAEVWAYTCDYDVQQGSDVMTSDITVCDATGTVLLTIEGITAKRSAESVLLRNLQVNTAPLLYQQDWLPAALPQISTSSSPSPQHYLLVADRSGVATRLGSELALQGHVVSLLWPTFSELQVAQASLPALRHLHADLTTEAELQSLWQHCASVSKQGVVTTPTQLVYAAALDLSVATPEFQTELTAHYGALLTLVQQIAQGAHPFQLWLLLDNTASSAVAQSALLGLSQVIALEHADLWRATVLMDGVTEGQTNGGSAADISALTTLLQADIEATQHEPLWRLQQGSAALARLERLRLPAVAAFKPQANRTYLITGGLGALGRQVAESLLQRGACSLLLTGRKAPDAATQQWLQALAGNEQIKVQYQLLEVADSAAVSALVAQTPDLGGVFHCAGALDDGLIADQTMARFSQVFAGKALGAWHLHQATRALTLDCFVLFSSVTALFGSPGQSNYVAANQFLNALATLRQQQGLVATAVNWGPWLDGGMASDDARRGDRLAARGIHSLSPAQGMAALWQLLTQQVAAPAVVDMDWALHQGFAAPAQRYGLFSALLPDAQTTTNSAAVPAWLSLLQQAEPAQRLTLLLEQMNTITAKVLGYSPQQSLDPDLPLMDLGADSLMMVEARSQLASAYRVKLPASFFFNYPTLRKAADYLLQQALPELQPKIVATESSADVLADIAALLD